MPTTTTSNYLPTTTTSNYLPTTTTSNYMPSTTTCNYMPTTTTSNYMPTTATFNYMPTTTVNDYLTSLTASDHLSAPFTSTVTTSAAATSAAAATNIANNPDLFAAEDVLGPNVSNAHQLYERRLTDIFTCALANECQLAGFPSLPDLSPTAAGMLTRSHQDLINPRSHLRGFSFSTHFVWSSLWAEYLTSFVQQSVLYVCSISQQKRYSGGSGFTCTRDALNWFLILIHLRYKFLPQINTSRRKKIISTL